MVPTFASVAAWGAGPGEMNLNRVMVVDGERDITFHKPFATAAHITANFRVLAVFDKGKDKGAVIRHKTVLKDDKGEALATLVSSRFARGDGGSARQIEGLRQPHSLVHLCAAADEAGECRREAGRINAFRGPQRGKFVAGIGVAQLHNPLGPRQIAQLVGAQLRQPRIGGQVSRRPQRRRPRTTTSDRRVRGRAGAPPG